MDQAACYYIVSKDPVAHGEHARIVPQLELGRTKVPRNNERQVDMDGGPEQE
jgi:hypothetical protein